MTRNRKLFLLVSLLLVLPVLAGTLLAAAGKADPESDSLFKYLTVFTEVLSRVRDNYVDRTDAATLMTGALDGAVDALDPFALYVPPDEVAAYQAARELAPRRTGMQLLKQLGVLYVVSVAEGSPAEQAGLEPGDIVAELAGESTRVMPLWRAVQLVARPVGTEVALKVVRLGEMKPITIKLGSFEPLVAGASERGEVGVLRLGAPGPTSLAQVEKVLKSGQLASKKALILDLRPATGGSPEVAFQLAGLFSRGELGSLRHREEVLQTYSSASGPLWQGRLVVLADRGTQGAGEVLATVLRQTLSAQLVGDRTFGHAGREDSVSLSSGGRLYFSSAFYAGPDGKLLRESLVPDVRVDAGFGDDESAAGADPVLERALELLASPPGESARKAA